jgi:hypothetical protein
MCEQRIAEALDDDAAAFHDLDAAIVRVLPG